MNKIQRYDISDKFNLIGELSGFETIESHNREYIKSDDYDNFVREIRDLVDNGDTPNDICEN